MGLEVTSDGKRLRTVVNAGPAPEKQDEPTPQQFHRIASAMLCRVGTIGGLAFARNADKAGAKEIDIDALFPVSDFKAAGKEKVGGRDAKVVQYNVTVVGKSPAPRDALARPRRRCCRSVRSCAGPGRRPHHGTVRGVSADLKVEAKTFAPAK